MAQKRNQIDFSEIHLYIHGNTALYIKYKVQLNYTKFSAIVFIKWKHSGGQAIQMLFNTYIFHCSVILRCTAQLTFGQSCWKSCEIILKSKKTSPDRHWDRAVMGDRHTARQRNNSATSCNLQRSFLCSAVPADSSWAPILPTPTPCQDTHVSLCCSSCHALRKTSRLHHWY